MDEFTMKISGVCNGKEGKKAYVSFSDERRSAEGVIPECKIIKQSGFTDEEIARLELFMKMNLADLKKQAGAINPVRGMLNS